MLGLIDREKVLPCDLSMLNTDLGAFEAKGKRRRDHSFPPGSNKLHKGHVIGEEIAVVQAVTSKI